MNRKSTSIWFRRALIMAMSLVVLIGVVIVGDGLYTRTEQFCRWAQEQIVIALREVVDGEVTLGDLRGSLWEDRHVQRLVFRRHGVDVIVIPHAVIRFGLLEQLRSGLHFPTLAIANISVQAPVIQLQQEDNGEWNLVRLFATLHREILARLRLLLRHVRVDNGQIAVHLASGRRVSLNAVTIDGVVTVDFGKPTIDIATLSFVGQSTGFPDLQWSGGLTYEGTGAPPTLRLRSTDLRAADSHIVVSGTVRDLHTPHLSFEAVLHKIRNREVRRLLPAYPLQQDLSATFAVIGPLSALQFTAKIELPDGRITGTINTDLTQRVPQYQGHLDFAQLAIDKVFGWDTWHTQYGYGRAWIGGGDIAGRDRPIAARTAARAATRSPAF